jgi:hypothetical protein
MTRIALPVLAAVCLTGVFLAAAAVAEPMKGDYEVRCQDPKTRQWAVAGRVTDPEIVDRPGGGREARGKGPDGKPVVVPMPGDRTCMVSGL